MTCPLEVVKTRLQSSCSGFQVPKIAQETPDSTKTTCRTVPSEQRRRLWTSSCHCRPQVVALSGYVPRSSTNSVTLVQCLKHIIKYEGPLALFKGNYFFVCIFKTILCNLEIFFLLNQMR